MQAQTDLHLFLSDGSPILFWHWLDSFLLCLSKNTIVERNVPLFRRSYFSTAPGLIVL